MKPINQKVSEIKNIFFEWNYNETYNLQISFYFMHSLRKALFKFIEEKIENLLRTTCYHFKNRWRAVFPSLAFLFIQEFQICVRNYRIIFFITIHERQYEDILLRILTHMHRY